MTVQAALNWRPACSLQALQARAGMNRQIRAFFQARGVLEVETPALSQAGNTDPNINSFTVDTSPGQRYLHTSPEYPMKRLLAAGSGDIFQICKVWRQEENGPRHNPEFSLLEFYRVGFSYQRLMQEVAELLHCLIPQLVSAPVFLSYRSAFLETLQIDPHLANREQLAASARQQGLDVRGELSRQDWCDLLFTHCIEPGFATDRLTFVYHYPAEQAAMACTRMDAGQRVAERFEVYRGGLELGNGYQEQTDAQLNRNGLNADAARHPQGIPVDALFLAAVQAGMPKAAGVAIGLDRVLLCRMQEKNLNRVISFPWELA